MSIESVLIFFSSAVMIVGTYVIWFSRYNIPNHLMLGTIFVAYLVPLFLTDVLSEFQQELVTQYAYILTIGAVFYVIGLVFGHRYVLLHRMIKRPPLFSVTLEVFMQQRYRFLVWVTIFALFAMILSWMYIGTVPMFAEDPFSAKFFKGEYYEAYSRVAIPYRLSQMAQITLFPILVALWFLTRRKLLLVLVVTIMVFFAMALTRALVFSGIFTLIALYATRKKRYIFGFIFLHVFVISVGSAIYYLIGLLFGSDAFGVINAAGADIWTVTAAGSPDIFDQLSLLQAFDDHGTYTLGRTFFGGLVPGQFYWNPSAWSLYLANNTDDITDVSSGGFRIPVAMWGYFSFGWFGVVMLPALSGLVLGASTRYIQGFISNKNILTSVLALSFYTVILAFFWNFHLMSMYAIPAGGLLIAVLYKFAWSAKR